MVVRTYLACSSSLALILLANHACAQTTTFPDGQPTFHVDPAIDLPILAISGAMAFGWMLGPQLAPAHCAPLCDRASVWRFDRFSAGWYNETWHNVAHVSIGSVFVLAGTTLLIDEGPLAALVDAVVVGQAVLGTLALATMSNLSSRRPRPFLYGTEAPLSERESGLAAFS
jgi:hypothetical protein